MMNAASQLQVGYALVDITPEFSVPLAGFGNTERRMSQNILDPIFTTCTAFTDEDGSTVLLFSTDFCGSPEPAVAQIRAAVSSATGICENRILISASHSHSAPDISNTNTEAIVKYLPILCEKMAQAAVAALADRKPARLFIGKVELQNLNFIRHHILDDGTKTGYAGSASGTAKKVAHVCEPDRTMQLVKFVREGAKDILFANWQAHPCTTSGGSKYDISPDIVGAFRKIVAEALQCHVAYFTGAAGNHNCRSALKEEQIYTECYAHANAMASCVLNAGDIFTEVKTGKVRCLQNLYEAKIDHTYDHMADVAEKVQQVWKETNDRKYTDAFGLPLGIRSPYHAGAILRRLTLPATDTFELDAVTIGDVAIVTAPYEMFCASGLYIKENSPCAMTLVLSCANGARGYLPSTDAFEYIGYETDTTRYERGTAELLAKELTEMTRKLVNQ